MPKKRHGISQVVYRRGSGGLNIPVKSLTDPFDIAASEMIDFDVLLRDDLDQSTYSVFVGCVGCLPSDPITIEAAALTGYEPTKVEPVTQTAYRRIFKEGDRKFNSSLLGPGACSQGMWGLRVVDHGNRSNGKPMVWAAVVGLEEKFDLDEIVAFPIYMLMNHGYAWNGMGGTIWLHVFLVAPILIFAWRQLYRTFDMQPLSVMDTYYVYERYVDPREFLYELAILFFVVTFVEEMVHLFYAQSSAPVREEFWFGFFVVATLPNMLAVWFVSFNWQKMIESRTSRSVWRPDSMRAGANVLFAVFVVLTILTFAVVAPVFDEIVLYVFLAASCLALATVWAASRSFQQDVGLFLYKVCYEDLGHPYLAPIEIGVGFCFFFTFGAGLYVGPASIMLAGLLRVSEIFTEGMDLSPEKYMVRAVDKEEESKRDPDAGTNDAELTGGTNKPVCTSSASASFSPLPNLKMLHFSSRSRRQ